MRVGILVVLTAVVAVPARAAEADPAAAQFFETRVRPVLAERCYSCHSASAKKLKGEFLADSLAGLLKGGESGPALVPGHPEQSRLIEAVAYKNVDLQMPPKDKLTDQQISDLTTWVRQGAAWPGEKLTASPAPAAVVVFDLRKRKLEHWAWQPVKAINPPAVKDQSWVRDPVDQFVLARLESGGMQPAAPADKRALLRRVTFALTGLPPTPAEVDDFLADASPGAFAKVVDRLLASPRYGERWARHWLDLARYAETLGHEFDYVLPNAWRYRDYVIRAFNADVPYHQFVVEQLAGDLLPTPRKNPADGTNESIIGTGFQFFGESVHSPVDVRQNQADLIDNKIDVTGKAMLGMTIACARCHDHKFDAISAADYYSMYGLFESTRYAQRSVNNEAIASKCAELEAARTRIRGAVAEVWSRRAASVGKYLVASRRVIGGEAEAVVASQGELDSKLLAKWVAALKDPAAGSVSHPAFPWVKLAKGKANNAISPDRTEEVTGEFHASHTAVREGDIELANFAGGFGDWLADGVAFGAGAVRAGDFTVGSSSERPVATVLSGGSVSSGILSRRLEGTLRSPTFTIDRRYLFVHAAGQETRVNVCVEGLNIIRAPIYGGIKKVLKHDKAAWISFDLEMWKGRRAYIELADNTVPDEGDTNSYAAGGWMTADRVVTSDEAKPPAFRNAVAGELILISPAPATVAALADRYQQASTEAIDAWGRGTLTARPDAAALAALLDWLVEGGLLDLSPSEASAVAPLLADARRVEGSLPSPVYVVAAADGSGIDERVFIRGSHKNLGPPVPRRLLEALDAAPLPAAERGSGRLELAQKLVDPENPLVARVVVNRVWHHLFGRGIVPSTDNFGVLGEKPSDPALLDYLAARFVREGWSVKRLIRELVLSNTYQMDSRNDPRFEEIDPDNRLLHRANIRRLEGEEIRDEILAVSGRLDETMGGPGVNVFLTNFMEGRGRPASGPLDGAGRRSIYLSVRRNFLSPLLLAFDMPTPFSAMGQRSVSNVPAQALILLNDPFVVEQAKLWAKRVMLEAKSPAGRVGRMYQAAFCRPPTPAETAAALAFVESQTAAWNATGSKSHDDPRPWADLAHVLVNLKEFIFIN